jgi:S1-C subfamily serine protease
MRRLYLTQVGLAVVVLSAVAVAAAAQEPAVRIRERAFERARDAFSLTVGPEGSFVFQGRRGRLGVLVDLTPEAARDSIGARVAGVTPGGPADRAGVHTDDIVLRINGTRLNSATVPVAARRDVEGEQSAPGLRLIELASRLDEGDTVRLDVRRGTQAMTFTFSAGESDTDILIRRFGDGVAGAMPRLQEMFTPEAESQVRIHVSGSFADLELVRVNPGLAEYFGTSEGLLVVDAPSDSSLGLRAGDVILAIGGRRPTSPAHALRILSTYDAGENVSFEIFRSKRRTTVNGRLPARRPATWSVFHNSFEPLLLPKIEMPELQMFPMPPITPGVVRISM